MAGLSRRFLLVAAIAASCLATTLPVTAAALIIGGEGNKSLEDPGWPKGVAAHFNHTGRVAWWEGPPFGGGEYHSECRGNAKELSRVLKGLAGAPGVIKRIVVKDGSGNSFWLGTSKAAGKPVDTRIDWSLTVWVEENWKRLRKLPVDLNPTRAEDSLPPLVVEVFTSHLKWSEVEVPKEFTVSDQRQNAHGFTEADGFVLEGNVTTREGKAMPVPVTVRLEEVIPQKTGGYKQVEKATTQADNSGRWVFRKVPALWVRLIAEAEGFAPRVLGYWKPDGQAGWEKRDIQLARAASVQGKVLNEEGRPIAGATVRVDNLGGKSSNRYELPTEARAETDPQGNFVIKNLPEGEGTFRAFHPDYCQKGIQPSVALTREAMEIRLIRAGRLMVRVTFRADNQPDQYLVQMEPEGGSKPGTYGGSAKVVNGSVLFQNIPPGKYVVTGQPNPGSASDRSGPLSVEIAGGKQLEINLMAK